MAINPIAFARTVNEQFLRYQFRRSLPRMGWMVSGTFVFSLRVEKLPKAPLRRGR
jgi:hypothetical protein